MSLYMDESRPSLLQRQYAQDRRSFRADIAAKAKTRADAGLKLEKAIEVAPVEHIASAPISGPPSYWEIPSLWNMTIPDLQSPRLDNIADWQPDTIFTIRDIQDEICRASRLPRNDILSARRTQNIVQPRQLAMALCRVLTRRSMPEIGRKFNGMDHTTVLHAVWKMQPIMDEIEWSFKMQPLSRIVQLALDACWLRFPPAKYSRHGGRP